MSRKVLLVCLLIIFLVIVFAKCTRPPSETKPQAQVGYEAPTFKLRDLKGKEVSLEQFRGKIVMLDFWATWCRPCRMTMPLLEKLQREYPNDMILLAINLQESNSEVRDYVRQQNVNSEVLLDEEGSVGEAYGTESIPMEYLIDQRGVVRHIQVGLGPQTISQLRNQIEKLRN